MLHRWHLDQMLRHVWARFQDEVFRFQNHACGTLPPSVRPDQADRYVRGNSSLPMSRQHPQRQGRLKLCPAPARKFDGGTHAPKRRISNHSGPGLKPRFRIASSVRHGNRARYTPRLELHMRKRIQTVLQTLDGSGRPSFFRIRSVQVSFNNSGNSSA